MHVYFVYNMKNKCIYVFFKNVFLTNHKHIILGVQPVAAAFLTHIFAGRLILYNGHSCATEGVSPFVIIKAVYIHAVYPPAPGR